jgi:hypothetical protein
LSQVLPGDWLFDGAGVVFKIYEVSNLVGSKGFVINPGLGVDLTSGCVKHKYTIRVLAGEDFMIDRTWESDET